MDCCLEFNSLSQNKSPFIIVCLSGCCQVVRLISPFPQGWDLLQNLSGRSVRGRPPSCMCWGQLRAHTHLQVSLSEMLFIFIVPSCWAVFNLLWHTWRTCGTGLCSLVLHSQGPFHKTRPRCFPLCSSSSCFLMVRCGFWLQSGAERAPQLFENQV